MTLSRAVLVKGAGPFEVLPQLAFLAAFAALTLTLAVRRYRKTSA